jgi:hypothetical protein
MGEAIKFQDFPAPASTLIVLLVVHVRNDQRQSKSGIIAPEDFLGVLVRLLLVYIYSIERCKHFDEHLDYVGLGLR